LKAALGYRGWVGLKVGSKEGERVREEATQPALRLNRVKLNLNFN